MLGKIVQLLNVPIENKFCIVEGVKFSSHGKADLKFASLTLFHNPGEEDYNVTYCWEFLLHQEKDIFKSFFINNVVPVHSKTEEDLSKNIPNKRELIEEILWVIIPWSPKIETTAKKIAGRYPEEAILEMKPGDSVTVGSKETYLDVQAGNELFLIKKTR